MSKIQASAAKALRELQAYRRAQRIPAHELALVRWPDRAVTAGVAAKLTRRPAYRDSRPGDTWLARIFDRIVGRIAHAGMLIW